MKYIIAIFLILSACSTDDPNTQTGEDQQPFTEHTESSDFEDVISKDAKGDEFAAQFDEDSIVSDATYLDSQRLSAAEIQSFLESTPYNGRSSWLADERVDGRPVSQLIAETSTEFGINPIILLSRFQVEGSHISKSSRPGNFSVNRALGCGCFDGAACQSSNLGLKKQLNCAATVLRTRFDQSVDGSGSWVKSVSKRTLDPMQVTPESHATAALYAYTPWVLRGRGGNWLVWNITQRFLGHVPSSPTAPLPWIGDVCLQDSDCDFSADGSPGFCFDFVEGGIQQGICTLPCEGYCPDRTGKPFTFCAASDVPSTGICVEREDAANSFCQANANTQSSLQDRFIGNSSAPASQKTVCLPNNLVE